MREKILQLHKEGKSYEEISKLIPCAISTVWYHCSPDAKKKRQAYNKQDIKKFQKQIKLDFGGACQICGYNKCFAALEFHHIDASAKEDIVAKFVRHFSKKKAYEEAKKCILLCANCHREKHYPD